MVFKLSKKVHLCNFVLTPAKNLNTLIQFTYMHLKWLADFQKMVLFIMLWFTVSEILRLKSNKNSEVKKTLLSPHLFDILIANISWTVTQTPVNHAILWKSVVRTFSICGNWFNGELHSNYICLYFALIGLE